MSSANSILQQQPSRFIDRQQQQSSGSNEFQPRPAWHEGKGTEARVKQADDSGRERMGDRRLESRERAVGSGPKAT